MLQPGDVLVRVNGQLVTRFEPLEAVLDDSVGADVELQLQRGGKLYTAKLRVEDLDSITPAAYLEFGDAVVHTLSYQEARAFHRPIRGVFVAASGYMLRCRRRAARRGDHRTSTPSQVDDLARFRQRRSRQLGDGARVAMRYVTIDDPNRSQLRSSASIGAGSRRVTASAMIAPATGIAPICRRRRPKCSTAPASAQFPSCPDPIENAPWRPSLVGVTFDMPYSHLRRHRAQLSRHRTDHRRRARPDHHRSQHGAGLDWATCA